MDTRLRIVITADPQLAVPPTHYGGIERVIALLADGLHARGHEVTLVAHRESRVTCNLMSYTHTTEGHVVSSAVTIARATVRARPHVIHSFGRLATVAPLLPFRVPTVMSYQRAVTSRSIPLGRLLGGRSLTFVSCSRQLIANRDDADRWLVIPNAIDVDRYRFAPAVSSDAPLVFLGRIEPIKGTHVAISVAKKAGRRLVIAGNVPPEHTRYFDEAVQPHVDGVSVRYVGPVDDGQKSVLLSEAAALLMPVQWEEPFGIVMAEALACGTPVIGLSRGAVPEVVADGATGFVSRSEEEMAAAVARLSDLSRAACREAATARYSARALVDAYESLYEQVARAPLHVRRPAANESFAARRD